MAVPLVGSRSGTNASSPLRTPVRGSRASGARPSKDLGSDYRGESQFQAQKLNQVVANSGIAPQAVQTSRSIRLDDRDHPDHPDPRLTALLPFQLPLWLGRALTKSPLWWPKPGR